MSASIGLASLRGSTYRSVRLASSFAAALLDGFFEHPEVLGLSFLLSYFNGGACVHRVFLQPARGSYNNQYG